MNIVYIFSDNAAELNCSNWRCFVPAKALAKAGHTTNVFYLDDFSRGAAEVLQACRASDIIIIERNIGEVLEQIRYWRGLGKVVVADFDDAYNLMPPTNVSYRYWGLGEVTDSNGNTLKLSPHPLEAFKRGLTLCSAATTPSRILQVDWQNYAPVYLLPNYIDLEKYQIADRPTHSGVILGWGGSMSHLQSFEGSGVMHALKRICRARPDVRVAIHTSDQRVYRAIPVKEPQKYLKPWVPYADWAKELSTFDIGLAPLHGPYDDRRSWIKVLEYMVMQIPWVASDGPAYVDFAKYGQLVRNQPVCWEKALLATIDQLADFDRESMRLAANAYAISNNVDAIIKTFETIIKTSSTIKA